MGCAWPEFQRLQGGLHCKAVGKRCRSRQSHCCSTRQIQLTSEPCTSECAAVGNTPCCATAARPPFLRGSRVQRNFSCGRCWESPCACQSSRWSSIIESAGSLKTAEVGCQQLTAYSFSSSCCPGGPLLPMLPSRPPLPRLPLPRGSSQVSSLLSSTPSTTALTLTWCT
jgi:hypothetical protein